MTLSRWLNAFSARRVGGKVIHRSYKRSNPYSTFIVVVVWRSTNAPTTPRHSCAERLPRCFRLESRCRAAAADGVQRERAGAEGAALRRGGRLLGGEPAGMRGEEEH